LCKIIIFLETPFCTARERFKNVQNSTFLNLSVYIESVVLILHCTYFFIFFCDDRMLCIDEYRACSIGH